LDYASSSFLEAPSYETKKIAVTPTYLSIAPHAHLGKGNSGNLYADNN
jgi:hypothetical protein